MLTSKFNSVYVQRYSSALVVVSFRPGQARLKGNFFAFACVPGLLSARPGTLVGCAHLPRLPIGVQMLCCFYIKLFAYTI